MKPVFKCDFCDYIGTEHEVAKHEFKCEKNYNKKNCLTCANREGVKRVDNGWTYKCKEGMDIPVNHIYESCFKYEREEQKERKSFAHFNNPFGWF